MMIGTAAVMASTILIPPVRSRGVAFNTDESVTSQGAGIKVHPHPHVLPSGQRSSRPGEYEFEQRRSARDIEPRSRFSGKPLSELYGEEDRYYQEPEESHLEETQRARNTWQRSADPSYRSERPERPIRPPRPLRTDFDSRATPSRRQRWSQVDDTKCGICGSTDFDLMGNEDGDVFECHGRSGQFTLRAKPELENPHACSNGSIMSQRVNVRLDAISVHSRANLLCHHRGLVAKLRISRLSRVLRSSGYSVGPCVKHLQDIVHAVST